MAGHDPFARNTHANKRNLIIVSFLAILNSLELVQLTKIPIIKDVVTTNDLSISLILSILIIAFLISSSFQLIRDWAVNSGPESYEKNLNRWKNEIWAKNADMVLKKIIIAPNILTKHGENNTNNFKGHVLSVFRDRFLTYPLDPNLGIEKSYFQKHFANNR